MSLWYKPSSEITFVDIDIFCHSKQPEGARLDYKGIKFPKDLAKTIAAFANTLGGLIILGVDADKTDNMPVWPPREGLASNAGLAEQVVQISQESIYPPVRVDVSNVIPNEHIEGTVLLVVRVNESREAPHATEKNRRVYVYERTDNRGQPYELADVARIEQLLLRRRHMFDQREAELAQNIARGQRTMHRSRCPIRWASIAPVYPWRNVWDQYDCKSFHRSQFCQPYFGSPSYQTIPGGSFSIVRKQWDIVGWVAMGCSSITSNGTLFSMAYTEETLADKPELMTGNFAESTSSTWVYLRGFRDVVSRLVESANELYSRSKNAPGEVLLSVGLKNALGARMGGNNANEQFVTTFPDEEFRVDVLLQANDLHNSLPEIKELYNNIQFAFNAVPA